MTKYIESRDALATITLAITHTDCDMTDPYRPTCPHDAAFAALRTIMIDPDPELPDTTFAPDDDPYECDDYTYRSLRSAFLTLRDNPYMRDEITQLALDNSLCPLHFIDYAICFDDDDPECAQIRTIHPSHDT